MEEEQPILINNRLKFWSLFARVSSICLVIISPILIIYYLISFTIGVVYQSKDILNLLGIFIPNLLTNVVWFILGIIGVYGSFTYHVKALRIVSYF